jgi:F-type H+-transporting ATPase subunit b
LFGNHLGAVKGREDSINEAFIFSRNCFVENAKILPAENERILQEARLERDSLSKRSA